MFWRLVRLGSLGRTMHPQSPPLTIGETVLKESDDLCYIMSDI